MEGYVKNIVMSIFQLAAVMTFAAEPTISIEAKQRYPWNGLVDLKLTVTGDSGVKYDTSFVAKDMVGGTNITMATVRKSDGTVANVAKEQLLPGNYGWVWDAATDLPKNFKCDRVTVTGTANLITYSVKFNANGGTGTMSNESFTYGIAKTLTANAFTRTGYTFQGWATSANGNKVYNDKQSVSNLTTTAGSAVNLYAKWSGISYAVKFNANGGSGTMSNESFTYGTAKSLSANVFTKSKYAFFGWSEDTTAIRTYNDKQSVVNLTTTANSVINLYAIWTIDSLASGLNCTTLPRRTGDSNAWHYNTTESYDGTASVMSSGAGGGEADSWLETTVKGPATISFYYAKKHFNSIFTIMRGTTTIFTDSKGTDDGVSSWIYKSFTIPSGTYDIRFNYHHSGTGYASGGNGIRIDQFSVVYE